MIRVHPMLQRLLAIADAPDDGPELRIRHRLLIAQGGLMSLGGIVMIALVFAVGRVGPAMAPCSYVVCTVINFVFLHRTKRVVAARRIQLMASLILPFFFQWSMGGFVESGGVMLWALLGVVGSLLFETPRTALGWLAGFLALTAVSTAAEPWLAANIATGASATGRTIFFAVNIGAISTIVFALVSYVLSERDKAEEKVKNAKDKAESANRAKSVFLANMSHELRTPLSAILGFTQLMTRGSNLNKEQREWLDIIDRSGEHLLGMVDEILSLAKIESGRIEPVHEPFDVVRVLEDIGQMIKSRARTKGLRFSLELDSNLSPCLRGDAVKIRQILINLLGNAVKFTSKGSVWLRARSQAMADDPASVKLQLEVGDTGPGIAREQLETIFDSFTQGDSVGDSSKGVGLGLAISRSLVDRMDGEIDVKSEQGKGSLFTVTIPLEPADTSALGAHQTHEARIIGLKPGQPSWRILLVDDNRDNRALLTSTLDQAGFVSRETEDGEAAIEAFLEWQPHLIWMDMRMPVMDGYAATKKIRGLPMGKAVKIIAVTAHAFEEHREEILAAGCDDLVRKPFREHEIFDAMARHLGVEYLRDDVTEAPVSEEIPTLTAEMLSALPVDILDELREAALTLNRETMLAIVERIRSQAPNTASGLRGLVDKFQMGRIGDLLRAVPRTGNTTSSWWCGGERARR